MSECKIEVYWEYEHVADLFVDYDKCTARVINYSKEWCKLPFLMLTRQPTWKDYKMFIDSRVFPRERKNCKEILKLYGLQYYDQEAICRKSHAVMFDDLLWFRYPGEEVTYDDVKVRD